MRRIGIAFVALVGGCSCNGGGGSTDSGETTTGECDDGLSPAFTASQVAGAGTVTFATSRTGNAWIEAKRSDQDAWSVSGSTVDASTGSAPVFGLRVASDYKLRVAFDGGEPTCAIDVTTDPPPTGTPAFTLNTWNPDKSCLDGGYVLMSYLGQKGSGVGILDRDGKYVWALADDPAMPWGSDGTLINRAHLGRDGKSVTWNTADANRVADLAEIIRVSLDGTTTTRTRTLNGHHDFVELPDGTMGWAAYEFRTMDVPGIGDALPVASDVIYEGPEGMTDADTPTEIWNTYDDYPPGIYDSGPEMEDCETGFLPGYCEFSHMNSLTYAPWDDTYIFGYRWLDAVVKVDRDPPHAFVWQFGGDHNDFTGDDSTLFVHSHFSDVWHQGNTTSILMMDNHDGDPPSSLVKFDLDESNMTFERTWHCQLDYGETVLGDVRRMPIDGCENYIASLSTEGRIVEMTPDCEVVWDVGVSQIGNVVARVTFLPSLVDAGDDAYWNPEP